MKYSNLFLWILSLSLVQNAYTSFLNREIALILTRLDHIIKVEPTISIYKDRDTIAAGLRQELLNEFGDSSRLSSLPHITSETYNQSIRELHALWKDEKNSNKRPDLLLHAWSYITGIPIIGLNNGGYYYYENKHMSRYLKSENHTKPTLQFTSNSIYISQNPDSTHNNTVEKIAIPVPAALRNSAVYFWPSNRSSNYPVEAPQIVWEFLEHEVASLTHFITQNNATSTQIGDLLDCLLRLSFNNKMPMYTHGIIKLMQNTVIYLSLVPGNSRIIVGPCSVAGTSYLGLKDGIFIEGGRQLSGHIDYLFGMQFFRRAFFRNYQSSKTASLQKASYFPHYTFETTGNIKPSASSSDDGSTLSNAGLNFRIYMQGTVPLSKESAALVNRKDATLYTMIENAIQGIERQQLSVQLIARRTLEKELGNLWIDKPDYQVDLSGPTIRTSLKGLIGDESSINDSSDSNVPLLPLSHLLKHLTCIDFQNIGNLNLSGNKITEAGLQKIAELFAKNVLPKLQKLDISGNAMSSSSTIISAFVALLRRDQFKYFVLYLPSLDLTYELADSLFKKVIWVEEANINLFERNGRITNDQAEVHRAYYMLPS